MKTWKCCKVDFLNEASGRKLLQAEIIVEKLRTILSVIFFATNHLFWLCLLYHTQGVIFFIGQRAEVQTTELSAEEG